MNGLQPELDLDTVLKRQPWRNPVRKIFNERFQQVIRRMNFILIPLFTMVVSSVALALPGGWQTIKPGGDTMCARGGEFSFAVRPGDPRKVVIEFGSGGACWDSLTCGNTTIFKDTVDDNFGKINSQSGIYEENNIRNPYRGWTHVVIPYCTGDLHLGVADATYFSLTKGPMKIHHRGGVNAKAALDWVHENYPLPTDISVSGCSAGSYASVIWTAYVAEQNKFARIMQFGDSGAGVTNRLFFAQWGMQNTMPSWIPSFDPNVVDWSRMTMGQIYKGVADFYPNIQFSQFNHESDRVQSFFYAILSGNTSGWRPRMFQNMEEAALIPNFRYYVASGADHCASVGDRLYWTNTNGVALIDWLSNIVKGLPVRNVTCTQCSHANNE